MSNLFRDDSGKYPAYAWPGGYPLYYVCADGGCLCPACANGANGSEASESNDAPDWRLIGARRIAWHTGSPLVCDHCGTAIESAYGDPDSEA